MTNPIGSGFPAPYQSLGRTMFRTLGIASSGLSAQRQRLEVIATNVANAETTRTDGGTPYRRRVVRMEAATQPGEPWEVAQPGDPSLMRTPTGTPVENALGVRVTAVEEDPTEGPLVYEPGHPDADANGYVRYPNVSITDEMVDLMDARRVYEANATVFQSAKAMLRRSLDI
jgi:flagellar basal-body rod protein FlgC